MTGKEYQQKATKFLQKKIQEFKENNIDLGKGLNAALGLVGEAGEFVAWRMALACTLFSWNLDDIFQGNNDKPTARYHGGTFNKEYANNKVKGDV